MSDEDGSTTTKVVLGAVVGATVVAAGGYLVYSYLNPNVSIKRFDINGANFRRLATLPLDE
jgi:hypothetical protein